MPFVAGTEEQVWCLGKYATATLSCHAFSRSLCPSVANVNCVSSCAVMYLYQIYQNNMAPTVLGLFPMFVGAVSVEGTYCYSACIMYAVHVPCFAVGRWPLHAAQLL